MQMVEKAEKYKVVEWTSPGAPELQSQAHNTALQRKGWGSSQCSKERNHEATKVRKHENNRRPMSKELDRRLFSCFRVFVIAQLYGQSADRAPICHAHPLLV
jgi:hypothetical protein